MLYNMRSTINYHITEPLDAFDIFKICQILLSQNYISNTLILIKNVMLNIQCLLLQ